MLLVDPHVWREDILASDLHGSQKILPGVVPVFEVQPGWCPGSDAVGQCGHTRRVFEYQQDVLAEGKCLSENDLYVNDFFSRRRYKFEVSLPFCWIVRNVPLGALY